MKTIHLIIILWICSLNAYSQSYCGGFEDTIYHQFFTFDTINGSLNIWHIGHPQKPHLNSGHYLSPNVLITDTVNPYPVNNYSSVTTWQITDGWNDEMGVFGVYWVNSDTLNDFGTIDFSPDNGTTWINLCSEPLPPGIKYSNNTHFSGNSNGWLHFSIAINSDYFNINPIGDTVLYRISFSSDSIFDGLDGLMFDDLCFYGCIINAPDPTIMTPPSCFPNPASDHLTIKFGETVDSGRIEIFSSLGVLVQCISVNGSNSVFIDISSYRPGVYFYTYINSNGEMEASGKFVKLD